ncbi:MAG: hypothetical protein DWQ01_07520 [Planctomycetota bacterium]|nr:MAG: hypothetical protein DWQ01_07520 [Planctomycetota bacterium]
MNQASKPIPSQRPGALEVPANHSGRSPELMRQTTQSKGLRGKSNLLKGALAACFWIGFLSLGNACQQLEGVAESVGLPVGNDPDLVEESPAEVDSPLELEAEIPAASKFKVETIGHWSGRAFPRVGQPAGSFLKEGAYTIHPISRSMAQLERRGTRLVVLLNGSEGESFLKISSLAFSSQGKHLIYLAETETHLCLVMDQQIVAKYVLSSNPRISSLGRSQDQNLVMFSEDEDQFAYLLHQDDFQGGTGQIILNGEPVGEPIRLGDPRSSGFSPQGKLFFVERTQNGVRYVVDGVPGPELVWAKDLRFSPSGHKFSYLGDPRTSSSRKLIYVNHELINGEEFWANDALEGTHLSSDLDHFAHVLANEDQSLTLYLNGQMVGELGGISYKAGKAKRPYLFRVGPGGVLVYQGPDGKIYANGKVHGAMKSVQEVFFSPDGSKFVYLCQSGAGSFAIDQDETVMGPLFPRGHVSFSSDSRHFLVLPYRRDADVYLDGKLLTAKGGNTTTFRFSEDGKRLYMESRLRSPQGLEAAASVASQVGLQMVQLPSQNDVQNAASLDGRWKATWERSGHGKDATFQVVVNGRKFRRKFIGSGAQAFRFDPDGVLRFICPGTENRVLRVSLRPE